ncbi:MAG: hypothetical protein R3B70_27835 [Polyangiaceae bacterium]
MIEEAHHGARAGSTVFVEPGSARRRAAGGEAARGDGACGLVVGAETAAIVACGAGSPLSNSNEGPGE